MKKYVSILFIILSFLPTQHIQAPALAESTMKPLHTDSYSKQKSASVQETAKKSSEMIDVKSSLSSTQKPTIKISEELDLGKKAQDQQIQMTENNSLFIFLKINIFYFII